MPETINGDAYYRTSEVCKIVGISRNTLFRWLKKDSVTEVEHRDYRGWRLFTQAQIDALKKKTSQINTVYLRKQFVYDLKGKISNGTSGSEKQL